MKEIITTEVLDFGQHVTGFLLDKEVKDPVLYKLKNGKYTPAEEDLQVIVKDGSTAIRCLPFPVSEEFQLRQGKKILISGLQGGEVTVRGEDRFEACEKNGTVYRLYTPPFAGPHPLVLFLHGGGECGTDNLKQLTGTLGAISLAKRWPDMYIMAPQAPDHGRGMQFPSFDTRIGAWPQSGRNDRGWNRDYLGRVFSVIREMISEGNVDPDRIYVLGLSMGGAGTVRAVSMAPDLFAAAAPICPSINGETRMMLEHWPHVPVWVSTSYIDHQADRHAYLANTFMSLLERGYTDTHLTLYTAEELAQYGIGTDPDMDWTQKMSNNHWSWVLTLHNEKGILDWLVSHRKGEKI